MLKIIKYLSYNKNKSKKNYIKCTKFKVSTNFITNFYLLGIQKVLDPDFRRSDRSQGQTGLRDRDSRRSGQTGGQRDRDSRRSGQTGHGHGERPRFVFSNKMSYLNK